MTDDTTESFRTEAGLDATVAGYAEQAVAFANEHFKITLDWSDASVQRVETILDRIHLDLEETRLTRERVAEFAMVFGSYIGEVLRRNHGATWGLVGTGDAETPSVQTTNKHVLQPGVRVYRRIVDGYLANVWNHFQHVTRT